MEELRKVVFEALGEASMCWSEMPQGIFDSENAKRIGEEVMSAIEGYITSLSLQNEHTPAIEQLARDQHAYLLEIAPHSYQEGNRAAHLREQWQALGLGEEMA